MERQRARRRAPQLHSNAFLGMGAAMHVAGTDTGWASRDNGTVRLEEAVAACRAALEVSEAAGNRVRFREWLRATSMPSSVNGGGDSPDS
jgi:hypothetical protein